MQWQFKEVFLAELLGRGLKVVKVSPVPPRDEFAKVRPLNRIELDFAQGQGLKLN
jgi:hypothetical protein